MTERVKTCYEENILSEDEALALYLTLRDSIDWTEGIRSRKGFTRMAFGIEPESLMGEYRYLLEPIVRAGTRLGLKVLTIGNVYLNYYRDGNDYTPNHSHTDSKQLVISLGTARNLVVGKKRIKMTNGSGILFGSAVHGVPKDESVKEGRISIAVFLPNE